MEQENNNIPPQVKICHIVHIDKLPSILAEGGLLCDAVIQSRSPAGTTIGMDKIKRRRLEELTLSSYPDLHVGDCVPFYFCPRSVMLYIFYRNDHPEIDYHGGQEPVLHLVADMYKTMMWAKQNRLRWAFTTSNAGSFYFEDYTDEADLNKLNWDVIRARDWQGNQEAKQAEFLIEKCFPWHLVERIGVYSDEYFRKVSALLAGTGHQPVIEIKRNWYY